MSLICKSIKFKDTNITIGTGSNPVNAGEDAVAIGGTVTAGGKGDVAIGEAVTTGAGGEAGGAVAIGRGARTDCSFGGIAIGRGAKTTLNYGIAIGGSGTVVAPPVADASFQCVIGNFAIKDVKFKGGVSSSGVANIHCYGINATGDISATSLNVKDISCGNSLHAPSATIKGTIQCFGLNVTGTGTGGITCRQLTCNEDAGISCRKLKCTDGSGVIRCKQLIIENDNNFERGSLSYDTTNGLTLKSIGTGLHLDASSGKSNVSATGSAGAGGTPLTGYVVTTLDLARSNFNTYPVGGTSVEAPSDHRIKQNISSIPPTDSLNKLSLTNPTSFNFKKDHIYSEDSLQHGFMAQELKEHFPETVTVSTGYLPIDLSSVKVTYSDPSKTILRVANLASYEINDNTKLSITNPSGDTHLVKITDFDNNTNSITLDKNIPDNFVRLRFLVDDFHYVQYDKFIPITISAIKKLKSTQDELIDSIKKLTQKVELLERKHTLKRFL